MKKTFVYVNIIFWLLFLACFSSENKFVKSAGKNFYVDSAVEISGDGSSWEKAWKELDKINYKPIGLGDIINIKAGTYNTIMRIKASGTPSNLLVIKPIGQVFLTRGIRVEPGFDYVKIDGFDISNTIKFSIT
jgi:hypothetical protein